MHQKEMELCRLCEILQTGKWSKDCCKEFIPATGELCVIGQLVLRGARIVVPQGLWSQVLALAHEGLALSI